jgi:hypothetical protein
MAHGVEPVLPFDIILATFLVPDLSHPMTTAELIAACCRQLERRKDDLEAIHDNVLKSRYTSARHFEKRYEKTIHDYKFKAGDLVLVRNSRIEEELDRKTKPRYFGPMVVIRKTRNGAYRLAELDGAVSKLPYAAFRIVPYHARSRTSIPVTRIIDHDDLVAVAGKEAADSAEDLIDEEEGLTGGGQDFLTPREV